MLAIGKTFPFHFQLGIWNLHSWRIDIYLDAGVSEESFLGM